MDLAFKAGNKAYQKDTTLLNNSKVVISILEKLAETIFRYIAYSRGIQVMNIVEVLADKFPCLMEPRSFIYAIYGWQQRIKYKIIGQNYKACL